MNGEESLIGEGHQDSQYSSWSGASETILSDVTGFGKGAVDQVIGVDTDLMTPLREATNWRNYTKVSFWAPAFGVVVGAAIVAFVTDKLFGLLPPLAGATSLVLGAFVMSWGMNSSTFWKWGAVTVGSGLALGGLNSLLSKVGITMPSFLKRAETVTKRAPAGSGRVLAGQSNYRTDTSPYTVDPEMTAKDVTLAAEMSGPDAESGVAPVNYGQGGVTAIDHDRTYMEATKDLQIRGQDADNAFVEAVMPKTNSYQPQAFYSETVPTMQQPVSHYTAETKAGIQNVFNTYQAPAATTRRGAGVAPRRVTKNANGVLLSNELKGATGTGSVIGQ